MKDDKESIEIEAFVRVGNSGQTANKNLGITRECNMECSNQLYKGEIIRRFSWAIRPDGTLYNPLKQ